MIAQENDMLQCATEKNKGGGQAVIFFCVAHAEGQVTDGVCHGMAEKYKLHSHRFHVVRTWNGPG